MVHVTDRQLQARLQGTLAVDEEQALGAHLRECSGCQQRLTALQAAWKPLGMWAAPSVPPDLQLKIMAALPAQPATQRSHPWWRSLRVAAALLLAAGIGHGAGRMLWRPPMTTPPDAEAVAESLHLDDPTTATMLLAALDAPEGGQP
jgi:anti-sigma factor RsiW